MVENYERIFNDLQYDNIDYAQTFFGQAQLYFLKSIVYRLMIIKSTGAVYKSTEDPRGVSQLIAVDYMGKEIGECTKEEAHRSVAPILHKAFSIFLYNGNKLLIQKRSLKKKHSGGLWANTCCSHPLVGQGIEDTMIERLDMEMGITYEKNKLNRAGQFVYFLDCGGCAEYEYDEIYVGEYKGNVLVNREEVHEWKWIDMNELEEDMRENPHMYAGWFITAFYIAREKIMKP